MLRPQISIIMTALNTAAFVAEAIESILQQKTTREWELLFVDDGSTDETLQIVRTYGRASENCIRIFTHPGGLNRGISASRNLALGHAQGTLLAFLDSDDVWLPHHPEPQAALLETMPQVAMIYASAERWVRFDEPFDEILSRAANWGRNYLPPLLPRGCEPGIQARGALLKWFRKDESLVPCICTVLVRTNIAREVGGFCDAFRGVYDDQVFHAKVSLAHNVYANDTCVARYRQHQSSCCATSRTNSLLMMRKQKRFEEILSTYAED